MNRKTPSGLPQWLEDLLERMDQKMTLRGFTRGTRAKRKKTLPKVLSESEVKRFLEALGNPKHRAIAFVLYSGGLRVSEAARLRINDIDSERGQIHVRQGKGQKDRYVMLSPVVLCVLREYARVERPYDWLFPSGHRRDRHITIPIDRLFEPDD